MKKADGQVRAITSVIGLPIRATSWYVEAAKGAQGSEKEAADLFQGELMGGMMGSFDDLLREMLRAVYLGFITPEVEWEEREGRSAVYAIHSRNPELIDSWLYDQQGSLCGYLYAGSRIVGQGVKDSPATTKYERVAVPLDRCIHAVYERENGSPTGQGLWRPMYPHWYIKNTIYLLCGIGIERNWVGVPLARASEGAQWDDREAVLEILRRYRSGEEAAMVMPFGWLAEWFESGRNLADIMPIVNHHDALMARAALAQFLNLGQTSTGTQALASEHLKVFLDSLEAIARWIAQTLNQQLLRKWCILNYGEALACPRIRHRPIRYASFEALARSLSMLEAGQFVTPDVVDEVHLRAVLELPAIPEAQLLAARAARESREKRQQQPPGQPEGDPKDDGADAEDDGDADGKGD